jgi:hypothetical protein
MDAVPLARSLSAALLLALTACADQPAPDARCADISGMYVNAGTPDGVLLSDVLLQLPSDEKAVWIDNHAGSGPLTVQVGTVRKALQPGKDFSCSKGRIVLVAPQRSASELPPLASTREVTSYALEKSGTALLGHRSVTTSATAYGIPLRGPAHEAPDIVWRAAATFIPYPVPAR